MLQRAILFCALMFLSWPLFAQPQQTKPHDQSQPNKCEKQPIDCNHSNNTPTVVGEEQHAVPNTKGDNEGHWYDSFLKHPTDWLLVLLNAFLVGANILLWLTTRRVANDTSDNNIQQSKDMQASLKEAQRSAQATEEIAKAMTISAQTSHENLAIFKDRMEKQSRAYLTTNVGGGTYQDRAMNIRFGVIPTLVNNGYTPARNVKYRMKVGVLPSPLQENTAFPLPNLWNGNNLISPGQVFTISAPQVDGYFSDDRATLIMNGNGVERLYAWGEVEYDDVFGGHHCLKFCQTINWLNGQIVGYYPNQHNESD